MPFDCWFPSQNPAGGRPTKYPRREIVNAALYQARNGAVWRGLPHDVPRYHIVFHYFRCWQQHGTWERIHDRLRTRVRQRDGRTPKPAAAILDSQSVKTTAQGGPKGYYAGKKITGRKRHLVVDTPGLIWALVATPASVQDAEGAKAALTEFRRQGNSPE
jgi:transposase